MGLARIKVGDNVIVIAGRDKGRSGKVLKVIPETQRIIVQSVNMVKKHQRRTQTTQAGITSKEAAIHESNVMLFDDKKGAGTRVRVGTSEDGRKVRTSTSTDAVFD